MDLRSVRRIAFVLAALAVSPVVADAGSYGKKSTSASTASATKSVDIVATAKAAGSFKTLVAALSATGLDKELQKKGPFTVFAPTDEAFAKLPAGTVEALLKDTPKLKSILLYHVVAGRVTAADVVKLKSASTLNGKSVAIDASKGVMVDASTVTLADVAAKNGVIHVIDTVLIPS